MRDVGAASASWDEIGQLRGLVLGPVPPPENHTQHSRATPLTERQKEEARRRVILQSGPRLRELPGGRSDKS